MMNRQIWAAMVAKMVDPMNPDAAGAGIMGYMPMLNFPDAAFTPASAKAVCETGRIMGDGSKAPLTRVPTYGEIEKALSKWWGHRCEMAAIRAAPVAREALAAPEPIHAAQQPLLPRDEPLKPFVPDGGKERRSAPKPFYFTDRQLLDLYERLGREGDVACAIRAQTLRKKLELA